MKKLFIIVLMLITSLVPNKYDGNVSENELQNTNDEEIILSLENEIVQNEVIEQVEGNHIVAQDTSEIIVQEEISIENNNSEKDEIVYPEETQSYKEQPKIEKVPKVIEQPKQEDNLLEDKQPEVIKQEPKQEEKIYCVDGGSIHIYGDGANEHGYYKTWDEAFKAYEEYTKGWESTQFKVDQCACGLYYFYVTK